MGAVRSRPDGILVCRSGHPAGRRGPPHVAVLVAGRGDGDRGWLRIGGGAGGKIGAWRGVPEIRGAAAAANQPGTAGIPKARRNVSCVFTAEALVSRRVIPGKTNRRSAEDRDSGQLGVFVRRDCGTVAAGALSSRSAGARAGCVYFSSGDGYGVSSLPRNFD